MFSGEHYEVKRFRQAWHGRADSSFCFADEEYRTCREVRKTDHTLIT